MKTRFAMFAMLLCAALTFAACGANYTTPEGTLDAAVKAMNAQDREAYAACFVKDEQEKMKKETEGKEDDKDEEMSVEAGGIKKDGDFTIGTLKMKKDGKDAGEMKMALVEEDGEWKFSMKETMKHMLGGAAGGGDGDACGGDDSAACGG